MNFQRSSSDECDDPELKDGLKQPFSGFVPQMGGSTKKKFSAGATRPQAKFIQLESESETKQPGNPQSEVKERQHQQNEPTASKNEVNSQSVPDEKIKEEFEKWQQQMNPNLNFGGGESDDKEDGSANFQLGVEAHQQTEIDTPSTAMPLHKKGIFDDSSEDSEQTKKSDSRAKKEDCNGSADTIQDQAAELFRFARKFRRHYEDYKQGESRFNLPQEIYVVETKWFEKFLSFILNDQLKIHIGEQEFCRKITESHLQSNHPGKILNQELLKPFDKYIRSDDVLDSSNFVMKSKVAKYDGKDIQKVPEECWMMLKSRFGYDYELKRPKDKDTYSYWQKYELAHKYIRIHILPPYSQLTHEALLEIKPIKVFVNQDSTFRDVKEKIAAYISSKTGGDCSEQQLRLWKPNFSQISVRNFANFMQVHGLVGSEAGTAPRRRMDELCSGATRNEELKENPQGFADNIINDEIEKNSGVEFPGLQFDNFLSKTYYNHQQTKDSFGTTDILLVEQAEVVERPAGKYQFIFSFDRNNSEPGKCENCFQMKILRVRCPCGKAEYCSQICKDKDEDYHSNTCSYAQQLDISAVDFSKFQENAAMGVLGLSNMGNTCYMNSALQCLSNSELLRHYFLSMRFRDEINLVNPLGSKGVVVSRFAEVLYNLWAKQKPQTYYNSSYRPKHFKKAIGEANQLFSGGNQQDSMEFVNWLLDTFHEDLNRVKNKQYIEMPDVAGEDQDISKTFWEVHLQRNQSIIVDLMTGQYKSQTTCPNCNHKSIKFEPFTSVALPIPRQQLVKFFFCCAEPETQIFQGELRFSQSSADEPFFNAKQRIAVQASEFHRRDIQPYDFVIAVVSRNNFKLLCLFDDTATMNARALMVNPSTEYIFAYEIDKRALKPDLNAGLPPNYVKDDQEPQHQSNPDEVTFQSAYDQPMTHTKDGDDYWDRNKIV